MKNDTAMHSVLSHRVLSDVFPCQTAIGEAKQEGGGGVGEVRNLPLYHLSHVRQVDLEEIEKMQEEAMQGVREQLVTQVGAQKG